MPSLLIAILILINAYSSWKSFVSLPVKLGKLFNIIITFNLMPRTFLSFFRIAQQRNVLPLLIDVVEKEPDDPHTRKGRQTSLGHTDDSLALGEIGGRSVGSVPVHSTPAISVMASLNCRDDED